MKRRKILIVGNIDFFADYGQTKGMIGISKLYCGAVEASDPLRYGRESKKLPSHLLQFSKDKKPVVVWNMTKRCNLKCVHCYARAKGEDFHGNELTTEEGKRLIDDLAAFGSPVMLFSGGEPVLRDDLPELIAYAVTKGMRAVISTNGTLITEEKARVFAKYSLSYIGVSLDGIGDVHGRIHEVRLRPEAEHGELALGGAGAQVVGEVECCKVWHARLGRRTGTNALHQVLPKTAEAPFAERPAAEGEPRHINVVL